MEGKFKKNEKKAEAYRWLNRPITVKKGPMSNGDLKLEDFEEEKVPRPMPPAPILERFEMGMGFTMNRRFHFTQSVAIVEPIP